MGVKVRGGREVYAARACAGKYTPAPRLNALLMRSGLCPLRIGNDRCGPRRPLGRGTKMKERTVLYLHAKLESRSSPPHRDISLQS